MEKGGGDCCLTPVIPLTADADLYPSQPEHTTQLFRTAEALGTSKSEIHCTKKQVWGDNMTPSHAIQLSGQDLWRTQVGLCVHASFYLHSHHLLLVGLGRPAQLSL